MRRRASAARPAASPVLLSKLMLSAFVGVLFTTTVSGVTVFSCSACSAAAVGAMHGHWLAGFLAGMGFSLAAHLRGRLGDAIIAHAVANAVLAGWVLGFGRWDLW